MESLYLKILDLNTKVEMNICSKISIYKYHLERKLPLLVLQDVENQQSCPSC